MDTVMELEIGPGPEPGSYVVRVLQSVGGGQPTRAMTLDLAPLVDQRPLLEASVLSSSVSARRVMSDTETTVQEIGRRLFDAAFSGDVLAAYRTSLAVASERGTSVQIALRLTAPELSSLPWETLFDAETGAYLCRKEPLVRRVPAAFTPPVLALEPPMRILGMISSPRGLPALDVGGERERLEQALRPHLDSGRVELEWLDDVTWDGVHAKLLEKEWHVLHFIGHGSYDAETDEGVLAFVGRDGRADEVTASSLADLLDEAEPTPRLVMLNSCQSAASGTTDLFSGTAAALAHSGIRAVAAMQFSISDVAAIAFARGFYTALSYGRGIDEAVRSGRIGILGIGRGTLEWVTPVLYLRGEDTRLFDVAPMPEPPAAAAAAAGAAAAGAAAAGAAAAAAKPTSPMPSRSATPVPVAPASVPTPAPAAPAAPAAPPPAAAPTVVMARALPVTDTAPAAPAAGFMAPGQAVNPPTSPPPPVRTPPTGPTTPPTPPTPPERKRGSAKPWLIVGAIAVVAVGAAIGGYALLRPDAGGTREVADDQAVVDDGFVDDEVIEPLTVDLNVPMYADWTDTGLWCEPGEVFEITVTGTAWHDASAESLVGPDGLTGGEVPEARVYADANTASVIGGFDSIPEMFPVGSGTTYTCHAGGQLYLGINDTNLDGNSGEFQATVTLWEG